MIDFHIRIFRIIIIGYIFLHMVSHLWGSCEHDFSLTIFLDPDILFKKNAQNFQSVLLKIKNKTGLLLKTQKR